MSKDKNIERVWVTWEDHRRSRVLADSFSAEYTCFVTRYSGLLRYISLSIKTWLLIFRLKPKIVFCQNPSIVLNFILCVFKIFLKFKLISDRHTNFKFRHARSYNPKWFFFRVLSNFTLRFSDLVIVTNDFLKEYVECSGGYGAVLPDKIPDLERVRRNIDLIDGSENKKSALFVCTFSDDEPVIPVLDAFQEFEGRIELFVTGNYKKSEIDFSFIKSKNIHFLGYVSDEDYLYHISSVDFVIVLTDMKYTLNCGSYEALSFEKPMLLGDTETIRGYFRKGAVYTDLDKESIIQSVDFLAANLKKLEGDAKLLKVELRSSWQQLFEKAEKQIEGL